MFTKIIINKIKNNLVKRKTIDSLITILLIFRLYIPLYLHIENGDIIQMSDAQADSQTDANQKLTEQIKTEQKEKLESVFKTSNACSIETRC